MNHRPITLIPSPLLDTIVSDLNLERAFKWLCKQRKKAKDNSDVWNLRTKWNTIKLELQNKLRLGIYHSSPVRRYLIKGDTIDHWCAQDTLVQKAIALVIGPFLNPLLPEHC